MSINKPGFYNPCKPIFPGVNTFLYKGETIHRDNLEIYKIYFPNGPSECTKGTWLDNSSTLITDIPQEILDLQSKARKFQTLADWVAKESARLESSVQNLPLPQSLLDMVENILSKKVVLFQTVLKRSVNS